MIHPLGECTCDECAVDYAQNIASEGYTGLLVYEWGEQLFDWRTEHVDRLLWARATVGWAEC